MARRNVDVEAARRPRGRPPRVSAEQVVRAAIPLFGRFGYRNTTIIAIAEALGVSDASVLHYFPTKRAILEAALNYEDDPANRIFTGYLESGGLEALHGLATWGAYMEEHPESTSMHFLLSAEAMSAGSELHGRFDQRYRYIRERLTEAIQSGIERGEIRSDVDPAHEAVAFLAFLDGIRLQWMIDRNAMSLDDHTRAYVAHLVERITAPAAAPRGVSGTKTRRSHSI